MKDNNSSKQAESKSAEKKQQVNNQDNQVNRPKKLTNEKDTESIAKNSWNARKILIGCAFVALLILGGNFVINTMRSRAAETGSFSSANLDRVSRGVYRLRAEVFGNRSDPRREDTPIDVDRDLNLTISVENGLLSFNIVNQRSDIIIDTVNFRGHLRDRTPDCFHLISLEHRNIYLNYQEASRSLPVSIFTTNENHRRENRSWRWLTDLDEFREMFVLEFVEVIFYTLDDWYDDQDERIVVRYITSADSYRILEGEEFLEDLDDGYVFADYD